MSPFGLCRAGTAWELVHRILAVSLGAASATMCRHETGQRIWYSSFAGTVKHISICCRQTCPTDQYCFKVFLPLLGSKLRKQTHTENKLQ